MDFKVEVIADSIAPCGRRLTTIVATYPRIIHAEVMTHRDRARNAASSRAIPFAKMVQQVLDAPFVPLVFGSEQKGMQAGGEIEGTVAARAFWLKARDAAVFEARELNRLGVHKSLCNRLLEPFSWITVVMTATEWENFFRLRCHPDAEVHFQQIAFMIRDARKASEPRRLDTGEWHTPFVYDEDRRELSLSELLKVSVARCARVSYLTHDGRRSQVEDLHLYDRLCQGSGFGHWSPHEHVAQALATPDRSGPFVGWSQFRKVFSGENVAG